MPEHPSLSIYEVTSLRYNGFFNMVEELTGRFPDSDDLRNAIQAVSMELFGLGFGLKNNEDIARNYEFIRGVKFSRKTRGGEYEIDSRPSWKYKP
jgi:hypothetical protein